MSLPTGHTQLISPGAADVSELSEAVLFDQAQRWQRTGNDAEARAFVEVLLERDPTNFAAHLVAAKIYAARPETRGQADKAMQQASSLGALSYDDYELWCKVLVAQGAITPARLVLRSMRHVFADDPMTQLRIAGAYEELRDLPLAWDVAKEGLYRFAGALTAADAEVWLRLALRVIPDGWEATAVEAELLRELARLGGATGPVAAKLLLQGGRPRDSLTILEPDLVASGEELDAPSFDVEDLTEEDREAATVRAEVHVALNEHFEAVGLYDRFPPTDMFGQLNHAVSLTTVGRVADARVRLASFATSLGYVPRPAQSETMQVALDSLVMLVDMLSMSLAEQENDYDAKWAHLRRVVELSEVGYRTTAPSTQVFVLRLKLLAARTRSERDGVIAALDAIVRETDDEDDVVTNYVEALLWASQVDPPVPDRLNHKESAPLPAPLRQKADGMARANLVRRSAKSEPSELIKRARLAMLVDDRLTADALMTKALALVPPPDVVERPGGRADRWQATQLRAWIGVACGRKAEALTLMDSVMGEWRQDLNARVFYTHLIRLSGDVERAATEAYSSVEAAPNNVSARIMLAECLFDLAAKSIAKRNTAQQQEPEARTRRLHGTEKPSSGDARPSSTVPASATSESSDNLHQLIRVVAEYRRVIELHNALASWLASEPGTVPHDLGSELLNSVAFEEVCRQGLHAAVLASEGLGRLRLTGDWQLEGDVAFLVAALREHQAGAGLPHVSIRPGASPPAGRSHSAAPALPCPEPDAVDAVAQAHVLHDLRRLRDRGVTAAVPRAPFRARGRVRVRGPRHGAGTTLPVGQARRDRARAGTGRGSRRAEVRRPSKCSDPPVRAPNHDEPARPAGVALPSGPPEVRRLARA